MKKRKLLIPFLCFVAVLTLVGCDKEPGGNGNENPPVTDVEEFTVTLKYNNGEEDGVIKATESKKFFIEAPKNPKKDFMEFDYWATDEQGTTKFNFANPVTGDITIYAIYKQAFDNVSITFDVEAAAEVGGSNVALTQDTVFFGRFTLGKGMKLEPDKGAINTQGKTISFELTAKDNNNSVVFNAAGASTSGDTIIKLINLDTGTTVEEWSVVNKITVEKTIPNLPAGNYQITTSRSARVYEFSITEKLPQGSTKGISINTVGVVDSFLLGKSFDASGLVVSLVYENGREDSIELDSPNLTITPDDFTTAGKKTVKVSYQVNKDTIYEETYDVMVYTPTDLILYDFVLNSSRETVHRQEIFLKGSTFNNENCVVKAKCLVPDTTDKYIEFILASNEYTLSTPDMTTTGEKVVTVTYKNNTDLTAEYKIYVVEIGELANVSTINVDVNPANAVVVKGLTDTYSAGNVTNFKTINQAMQFFELANLADSVKKVINLTPGTTYFEKVEINLPNMYIKTEAGLNTSSTVNAIIEFNALNGLVDPSESMGYSTDGSATVSIRPEAQNLTIKNVTIKNYYNNHERHEASKLIAGSGTQAVALLVQADKAYFENVTLSSYQDTLYAQEGRHYFTNCTIEGRTDYIFGYDATSYFTNCTIKSIFGNDIKNGGYIVATKGNPSGTPGSEGYKNVKYGYVFDNCTFTAEETVGAGSVSIARGWDVGMTVMVMNSTIGGHVSKEAYGYVTPDDPNTPDKEGDKNDRYGKMNADPFASQLLEYNNTGAGAITASIAKTCTVITEDEAKEYTLVKVFTSNNGTTTYVDSWVPTLDKNASLVVKNSDDSTFLNVNNFGYVGTNATSSEYRSVITPETSPAGKVFDGFYANKELTTEYNYDVVLNESNNIYVKWNDAATLAATTVTFDGLNTGNINTTVSLANGLVKVVGHADRAFAVDENEKTITNAAGEEITTAKRLKTSGSSNEKGRYIIIDLSNYSGKISIEVFAATGSNGVERTGQLRLESYDGQSVGEVLCPGDNSTAHLSSFTVYGGYVYYITADASINFYGINIAPKTE